MIRKRNIVPSLFTMLNLFFGFFATLNAIKGNYVQASWLIIFAGIWDAIDGKIARMTETFSEFGIEFDSITDVVSFGVAPSVLIYQVFFNEMGALGVIISFLPLLFGAIRLARFNITLDGFDKENFTGLPIPFMASTLATFVMFNYDLWDGLRFGPMLIPLVLLLCYLMISHVEYVMVPKLSFREDRKNSIQFTLVIISGILIAIFREKVMFPMTIAFVLYFLFRSLFANEKDEEEEELLDITVSD